MVSPRRSYGIIPLARTVVVQKRKGEELQATGSAAAAAFRALVGTPVRYPLNVAYDLVEAAEGAFTLRITAYSVIEERDRLLEERAITAEAGNIFLGGLLAPFKAVATSAA